MTTTIDRSTCAKLRSDLGRILKEYGEANGLELKIGNMRFNDAEIRINGFTAKIKGEKSRDQKMLDIKLAEFGLNRFNASGDELIEFNARRYRYPFVYIRKSDGRKYKTDAAGAERNGH